MYKLNMLYKRINDFIDYFDEKYKILSLVDDECSAFIESQMNEPWDDSKNSTNPCHLSSEMNEELSTSCDTVTSANSGYNLCVKHILHDFTLCKSFQMISISSIPYDKKVLTFAHTTPLSVVLQDLHTYTCSCAIVEKNNRMHGIVDTKDIVSYILQHGYDTGAPISFCVQKFVYVYPNSNLLHVAQYLKSGFRYIIVNDVKQSIVSQGSMLRYIHANQHLMEQEDVFARSIQDHKICAYQKIISIQHCANVIEAYDLMLDKNVTSLPIVDEANACVSVISMSDIKVFANHSNVNLQNETCIDFVQKSRKDISPICCEFEDSLISVIDTMINRHIHHVYILDESRTPVGVVSYVDIIKLIFETKCYKPSEA